MNYLAHALVELDSPYFVAGTSIPDWLSVADRRVRARGEAAQRLTDDADPRVRAIAAGIVRHHEDDRWFHGTREFAELSMRFAIELRDLLDDRAGFRPSFLGHIAVELLIDAELIREDRGRADRYYAALGDVSPDLVEQTVNRIARRPTRRLSALVPHFIAERFLYDYVDDGRLLHRLNQVMRRVGLPALPRRLTGWLESARLRVRESRVALLTPPTEDTPRPS